MISGVSSLTKSVTTFADIKSATMTQPSYEAFQKMFFEWYLHFNWCLYFLFWCFSNRFLKRFAFEHNFLFFGSEKVFALVCALKYFFVSIKWKNLHTTFVKHEFFKGISKVPKVVLASFAKVILYINSHSLCLRLGRPAVIPCKSRII